MGYPAVLHEPPESVRASAQGLKSVGKRGEETGRGGEPGVPGEDEGNGKTDETMTQPLHISGILRRGKDRGRAPGLSDPFPESYSTGYFFASAFSIAFSVISVGFSFFQAM